MMRPRTILAASDLSENSETALQRAALLAREHDGARLELLHVLEHFIREDLPEGYNSKTFLGELTRDCEEALQRQAENSVSPDIPFRCRVGVGKAFVTIIRHAREIAADLIVLAAHGSHSVRDPREPILTPFLAWRVLFVSLILLVGTFGLFLWARLHEASIKATRTVAGKALIMFEVFYLINTRRLKESMLNRQALSGNRAIPIAIGTVLLFQLLFTYASPMQQLFGSAAIGLADWLRLVLVTASVFLLVELEKFILREMERRRKMVPGRLLNR